MAKTLYCKKCNMDVPEGEACPVCGKTPPASSMRVAWMYARQRALDWMSWNAVMRIAVPVLTAATALGLVLELLLGGGAAFYYFKFLKPKQNVKGDTDLEDFEFEDYDEDEPEADTGETPEDEETEEETL